MVEAKDRSRSRAKKLLKGFFTILVLGSAVSDILVSEVVVTSMKTLGYPLYLAPFLGWLKLLGLFGIWQTRSVKIKDLAFAGFFFDHLGASYSNAILGFPLAVDGVMAPFFLVLTVVVYAVDSHFAQSRQS